MNHQLCYPHNNSNNRSTLEGGINSNVSNSNYNNMGGNNYHRGGDNDNINNLKNNSIIEKIKSFCKNDANRAYICVFMFFILSIIFAALFKLVII